MDALAKRLNRELLRGDIARNITCSISGVVLDMKSAVSVTITGKRSRGSAVYDATAYDKTIAPNIAVCREKGYTVEIIDGRAL